MRYKHVCHHEPKGRLFGPERPHPTDETLVLRQQKMICNCGKERVEDVEQLKPRARSAGRPQNLMKAVKG